MKIIFLFLVSMSCIAQTTPVELSNGDQYLDMGENEDSESFYWRAHEARLEVVCWGSGYNQQCAGYGATDYHLQQDDSTMSDFEMKELEL